jgi:arsenate reductase
VSKAKVLFVCVENSCRSQIAEALANKLGKDFMEAWSAGSKPLGKVHETAIELLKHYGIDLSRQYSKSLSDLPEISWDYVVTMGCGDACPIVPSRKKLDWAIPDPKAMPLEEFRKVVDQIEQKVTLLIHHVLQEGR